MLLKSLCSRRALSGSESQLYYACMLSQFSHAQHFVTPWTAAHQDPLSMGFSRQEYWRGFLCPPPGDLPDANTEPSSLRLLRWQADSLLLVLPGKQVDFNSKPGFESQLY